MHSVKKHVLDNGLTVLVYPLTTIPKVAVQLWYEVGSKDEKDGERGLAHLLEHMIFKGTDILSESDINLIAHKLSGNCNAFTSHDYTGYLFDFPKQNWAIALPLLADCMRKCTFKEDLLNAELKAVIQELKMYKDDYRLSLGEHMISALFAQHPYHYPIIGYKQDLWDINRKGLLAFYAQHYVPNNATLVVVGDVSADDVIEQANKAFAHIPADPKYKKEVYTYTPDIVCHQITMKRDIQQPILMYAWIVPGLKENQSQVIELVTWILGEGKGSRLYKMLVDQLELATDMQVDLYEMFDKSVLFIHIDPVNEAALPEIEKVIHNEIHALQTKGVLDAELMRAGKQSSMQTLSLFENNQKIAYEIGKLFVATRNQDALKEFLDVDALKYKKEVEQFFKDYIRVTTMHKGLVLPLSEREKEDWLALQEESDAQDEKILSRKVRESTVECGVYVEKVTVNQPTFFKYPHAQKNILKNGLTLLTYSNAQTPKIDLVLELKVRSYYDPEDKQGLINFMSEMLIEGTQKYTDQELADAAESRGISIDVRAGTLSMSMLKEDLNFALDLLAQILMQSTFKEKNIAKVRAQILADIVQYWESPTEFASQLVRQALYKNHPYHKNLLGDAQSIKKITRADLLDAYKKYVSPYEARIAIVGDIEGIDVTAMMEKALSEWHGPQVPDIAFPSFEAPAQTTVNHQINRDQTVLCFAGHSVTRMDPHYDALLLFDQIFTGGILGSMGSYLFQLREQTGLFYTIGGSLVTNADEQPGLVYIRTIVSNDRLEEAQKLIKQAINEAPAKVTQDDIAQARNALINSMVDNFESNDAMCQAFLFVDRFKLSPHYFDERLKSLTKISAQQIKDVVQKFLDSKNLITVKIGRV